MTKRIIALLLALILTVGLLPTVALAAEGDPTTDGGSTGTISGGTVQVAGDPKQSVQHEAADDPIHIKKSVSEGENGKNYLTMEAYVTNPLEIKQEAVPIDIVLVLDVSGSMDDPLRNMNVPDFETYPNNMTNSDYLHYAQTDWGVYSAENKENKVNVTAADTYESVSRLTYKELKESGDNVSYYAKDNSNSGRYHSLSIKKYWGDWWNYYLYMDGEHYQKVHDWNSPIQLSGYEIYKLKTTYTYTDKTGNVILTSTGPNNRPTNNGQVVTFYYYNGETQKKVDKIDALKEAANNFIDKVAEQKLPAGADGNAQYNRISIVKFAGNKTDKVGDDTYRDGKWTYNYSQIVKSLTNVDAGGVTALQKAVNDLKPAGATRADYGMERAQEALKGHGTRPSVVIMFTDGGPTSSNGFEAQVASAAVTAAKALKDAGTLVYTIAVEKDADPEAPITGKQAKDINKYLHAVSSNYPNATANSNGGKFNVTFGTRVSSEKNYYFNATNAIGLNNVFETISREVSNLALVVDSTAVLSDTLSGFFTFDGVDADNKTAITVKRVPVTGGNATDGFTWADINDDSVTNIDLSNVTINGKSITVTGFNYGSDENAVTVHTNPERVTGAKLVITFPIKPDDSVTWTEGTANYPTNSITNPNEACLRNYALKSDKDNKNQKTQLTESPEIQYEAHKVSYVVDVNGYTGNYTKPEDRVYRTGTKYTIADTLTPAAGSGYTFVGWCTDEPCATTPVSGEREMGKESVIYYGEFKKNTTKVNLTDYIQKTLTATSLPNGYKETFKAKITGTPITAEGGLEITTPEFSAAGTQNFTGTAEVELTYGQTYTFTVTEKEPEAAKKTSGLTYDTTGHDFALKVSETGDVQLGTINATTDEFEAAATNSKVTIENTYAPGAASFSLAQKFQKVLNSNTANVPSKSFELTITGTSENTDKRTISGTADIGALTEKSTGKYAGDAYFGFANSNLSFNTAGTYTYKVQETAGSVAGMSYDSTEYTLTIVVDDTNGALTVSSAKVTNSTGTEVANLKTSFLTIENTFKAAELPLDPPTDPTQGTAKIVKALSSDSDTPTVDLTFKASLTGKGGFGRRVANATVKAGETTADFSGFGTLVFTGVDVYEYVISEDSDNPIPGVIYDQTRYTLKVDVRENDNHELYIYSAKYIAGQVEGNILETPITFTNKYTKPENATVVSKTVVTDLSTLSIPMQNDIHNFESRKGITILYPVANNGTNTLEVTKGTTTAWLLYKISVDAGTQQSLWFDDANVDNFWYKVDEVAVSRAGSRFKVEFKNNVRTADIYVTVNHALNFNNKGECTVENAIGEIKATTTVTEKDPDKLTINFSDFVKKELTATGTKTASDVDFRVNVKGGENLISKYSEGEEEVNADANKYNTVLDVHFDSITGGTVETKKFTGNTVEIDHAGHYYFDLSEEKGTRTGVTYDETTYTLYVTVEEQAGSLVITNVHFYDSNDGEYDASQKITFHNTIDTGIDDYYPIIIPTIINKDTGMLNKTDHFAYVIGYPDGTVHPNGQITRAEVATIFFRLLRDEVRDGAFTTSNSYSDVAYGKWYNNPISTMSALGIITGYPDGTFKPNKPITRAEFAAIAARFDETQSGKSATFSDVIGHWAAKEIGIAYYNDWIKGYPDGTFKPDQNITRAEAMTLINRVLERKPESPADLLTNMNKWTDNMDTSKWYYLDVQEATNSHGYTRKTFNYELWRQMLPDPDWSRYER